MMSSEGSVWDEETKQFISVEQMRQKIKQKLEKEKETELLAQIDKIIALVMRNYDVKFDPVRGTITITKKVKRSE